MIITVLVKTGKKEVKVIEHSNYIEVHLTAEPKKGKANNQLVKVLSKYFGKPVRIIAGFKSRKKLVELG